jgi:hypothetical protein
MYISFKEINRKGDQSYSSRGGILVPVRHYLGFYHNVGLFASHTHLSQDRLDLKAAMFSTLAVVVTHSVRNPHRRRQ